MLTRFPSRPTHGARILRVFANINPSVGRVWNVGEPFHDFLPKLMQKKRIGPSNSGLGRALAHMASKIGLPVPDRSPYDEFMLYLHDWLKENADFQNEFAETGIGFPAGQRVDGLHRWRSSRRNVRPVRAGADFYYSQGGPGHAAGCAVPGPGRWKLRSSRPSELGAVVASRFAEVHPQVKTKAVQVVGGAAGKAKLHAP